MKGSAKSKRFFLQFFGLFSLVRGYNIAVLIIAQYLTARYILAPERSLMEVLLDVNLFFLVLASAATTASGYIINGFFDAAKDQINRPQKYILEHLVSQQLQLVLYFVLSLLAVFFAGLVSFGAVLFFGGYILAIALYSSVLKRWYWLSNWFAALLMILPFFAITLYFKNFDALIFLHAAYLYLLILSRDLIKDLENFKGDWVHRYRTLPIVYGIQASKWLISGVVLAAMGLIKVLLSYPMGLMHYYFLMAVGFLLFVLLLLWFSRAQKVYLWLHNLLKLLILIGVFSIYFINK